MPRSQAEAAELAGLLQCEPPNARLHTFEGRLSFHALDGAPRPRIRHPRAVVHCRLPTALHKGILIFL